MQCLEQLAFKGITVTQDGTWYVNDIGLKENNTRPTGFHWMEKKMFMQAGKLAMWQSN